MLKLSGNLGKSLAALTVLGAAMTANADLSGNAFSVTASNETGTATWTASIEDMIYDGETNTWSWGLNTSVELLDPETEEVVAILNGGNAFVVGDPAVSFGFAVQAGSSATNFTISSALLSFGAINSAQAQAGAAFTITDTDRNGASISNGNSKLYNSKYNGTTTYADLVSGFTAGNGNSQSQDENQPANGYNAIGGPVTSIESSVSFTLSANDLASGTNSFEVIPEPSTLALVGLGALSMLRRR